MFTTTSKGKNSYGKRKPRRRRKNTYMDRKIARVANQVVATKLNAVNELKVRDIENSANITSAGTLFSVTNTIGKGTDNNNRIGDEIDLKSIYFRMEINANSTTSYDNVRAIVVRWYSDGTPAISDILTTTAATNLRHLSQINYDKRKLFRILYDNTYTLSDSANLDIPAVHVDKFYIKVPGKCNWDSSNNPVKGHVYLLLISDSASLFPSAAWTVRTKFQDP